MSDFLEDITEDNSKENIQMKSGEITGDAHMFHSLPKEFQVWHSNNYIMEKEGNLDPNVVTRSMLNAYMWKILINGTNYGVMAFLLVISTIFSEKLFESYILSIFNIFYFFGAAIYIAFHFSFFGIIRAQVIGPITEKTANVTSLLFYQTFASTFLSLMIVFVFLLLFSESLLELLFELLVNVKLTHGNDMDNITMFFFNFGVNVHNLIVKLVFMEGPLFYNVYFLSFLLPSIIMFFAWFVEGRYYENQRQEIIDSVSEFKLGSGYPIEKSQKVIKTWREKNGM